jgi:3',5'-cyclic AMP phosphodiesterase CpdA
VPNRGFGDASGEVGDAQLRRLGELLAKLPAGPRILVTHYPVAKADGRPEGSLHCLRDLDKLLDVAGKGRIRLWLHGHRHQFYLLPADGPRLPFPVISAGSATEAGVGGYNEYTIDGNHLHVVRRDFDVETRSFRDRTGLKVTFGEGW